MMVVGTFSIAHLHTLYRPSPLPQGSTSLHPTLFAKLTILTIRSGVPESKLTILQEGFLVPEPKLTILATGSLVLCVVQRERESTSRSWSVGNGSSVAGFHTRAFASHPRAESQAMKPKLRARL